MTSVQEIAAKGSKAIGLAQEIADAEDVAIADRLDELNSVAECIKDTIRNLRAVEAAATVGGGAC